MNVSSMYRAARLVGDAVREVRAIDGASLNASKTGFSVSCILGGQVGNEVPRLFQIYDRCRAGRGHGELRGRSDHGEVIADGTADAVRRMPSVIAAFLGPEEADSSIAPTAS